MRQVREAPPLRPRKLTRSKYFDGYVTTDGRYEVRAFESSAVRRGRMPMWRVLDKLGPWPGAQPGPGANYRLFDTLRDVRRQLCVQGNFPWLVCTLDPEPWRVLRREPTRQAAARWARKHYGGTTANPGEGTDWYLYEITRPGASQYVWIGRADAAHLHSVDAEQDPLYPYAERPGVRNRNAAAAEETLS